MSEQIAPLLRDEVVDGEVLMPQPMVAAMIGVQRPSLKPVLKDFERRSLLRVAYRAISVLDPVGLAKLVG